MNDGALTTNPDEKKSTTGLPEVEAQEGAPVSAMEVIEESQLPSPKQDEIDSLLADAEALSAEIVRGPVGSLNDVATTLEAEDIITQAASTNSEQAQDEAPAEIQLPDDATSQESSSLHSVPQVEPVSDGKADEPAAELKDLLNDPDSRSEEKRAKSASGPADESSPTRFPRVDQVTELAASENSESTASPTVNEVAKPVRPRRTPGQWVKEIRKSLLSKLRSSVYIILNCGFFCLTIFDIPFRGASASAKKKMGLAGLVTILMGLAAWVLPGFLEQNPFEHMETGVATDSPASPVAAEDGEQH